MPENSLFRIRISIAARSAAVLAIAVGLASCSSSKPQSAKAELDTAPKFTEKEVGVAASPRVTELKVTPKGGGRYQVGKPYKVRGKWYTPKEDPTYVASGRASWYGPNFHGRLTANGEVYNQYTLSAAHPTMPLPSYARVTNLKNGSSVMVRVNDRGPFHGKRIIDVSAKAADLLDFKNAGVADVKVEYVGRARIEGSDEKFLLASYRAPGSPEIAPGATQPGTMIAMAEDPAANPVAGAIDEQFSVGGVMLASIPVPVRRPALFMEGTPMIVAAMPSSLLMGYSQDTRDEGRIVLAFSTFDAVTPLAGSAAANVPQVDPELAARMAVISLGVFRDPAAADYVRQLFADTGLVSSDETFADGQKAWEMKMLVGGDAAGAVLELARERGFASARLLPDSAR
jgi:rare lipoprotein A